MTVPESPWRPRDAVDSERAEQDEQEERIAFDRYFAAKLSTGEPVDQSFEHARRALELRRKLWLLD